MSALKLIWMWNIEPKIWKPTNLNKAHNKHS